MNDHIKSEIWSYLAGDLPESRNRQIEAHTAACEKCNSALSKARSKQARIKREALKKAAPDQIPNFFWARQNKMEGPPSSYSKVWFLAGAVLVAGSGYWAYNRASADRRAVGSATNNEKAETPPRPIAEPAAPPPPPTAAKPASNESDTPPVVLHVLESWKGAESAVTESRLVVIRNAEAWQKLWTEMALKDPQPVVDFTKAIVLGVFAGDQPAGSTILLGRIDAGDEEVAAPYRITPPAAAAAVQGSSEASPAAAAAITHPYLLATIPRVDKKIRLTQKEKRS